MKRTHVEWACCVTLRRRWRHTAPAMRHPAPAAAPWLACWQLPLASPALLLRTWPGAPITVIGAAIGGGRTRARQSGTSFAMNAAAVAALPDFHFLSSPGPGTDALPQLWVGTQRWGPA